LPIKVSKFIKFSNKTARWNHFKGHPVQHIAYKCCIHFAKTKFRVPNIPRQNANVRSTFNLKVNFGLQWLTFANKRYANVFLTFGKLMYIFSQTLDKR